MRKLARMLLGFALLVIGLALSIPGVPGPGIAVIILGLVVLSDHFDWAKRLLEWAKRKAARITGRAKPTDGGC